MSDQQKPSGPDLSKGIAASDVPDDGMFVGHVGDENVLLARRDGQIFALSAKCTHYGGPLNEGLIIGDTVRCPWHHARFDLRSGEAVGAPALNPVACWRVDAEDDRVYVRVHAKPAPANNSPTTPPSSVVIVGGGAAGDAAAEMLRREGYEGPLTILSDDSAPPCDRPNLSKDYLAGNAQPDWIPLRSGNFYQDHHIDLRLNTKVKSIDPAASSVTLDDGSVLEFGALLLATGAEPVRLDIPGANLPHVHYLRTQADSESIIAAIDAGATSAVVIGASFIGLEVAASLRARDIDVHVVAPDERPLERIMGGTLGDFVRELHESKGVAFHLQQTVTRINSDGVVLKDGTRIAADLVVIGIGVRPRTALAEAAGLKVDHGVVVNQYLQTSAENIYAAGDIASWPDPISGERIRVEHWVVAQRQGQAVARNMLGKRVAYSNAPFFWSQHYDATINYVGHATRWDRIDADGDASKCDFSARFMQGDRVAAVATIYRDVESLEVEAEMEAHAAVAE